MKILNNIKVYFKKDKIKNYIKRVTLKNIISKQIYLSFTNDK